MEEASDTKKPHRKSKNDKKKKGERPPGKLSTDPIEARKRNPKAFALQNVVKTERRTRRKEDITEKRSHVPTVDRWVCSVSRGQGFFLFILHIWILVGNCCNFKKKNCASGRRWNLHLLSLASLALLRSESPLWWGVSLKTSQSKISQIFRWVMNKEHDDLLF